MKKDHLKATSIKTFLLIAILLITTISIIGFYFAQSWLKDIAEEYSQEQTTSSTSVDKSTIATKRIQNEITKYQSAADKADAIFIPSQDYQNLVINNLKTYASTNNITISDYSFNDSNTSNTPATKSNLSNSNTNSSNLNSKIISITLGNPIQFTKLIKFMKQIETNSPKMQLTGVNISSNTTKDTVTVEPLIIEIYSK